jgi:hypothetical protein
VQQANAHVWVARLSASGFAEPLSTGAPDVTVATPHDEGVFSWYPCDWLAAGRLPYATPTGDIEVTAVWRRGESPGPLAVPAGFEPGQIKLEFDEFGEASEVVTRALAIDPNDALNQRIRTRLRRIAPETDSRP